MTDGTTYVVHSVSGAARALAVPLVSGAVFVTFAGFVRDSWTFAGVVGVLILGLALVGARSGWRRLVVSPGGLELSYPPMLNARVSNRRSVPWTSVRRVSVDAASEMVTVQLRADAPMPDWLTARITDPRDPEGGVSYQRHVPGVDPVALQQAVRTVAPEVWL